MPGSRIARAKARDRLREPTSCVKAPLSLATTAYRREAWNGSPCPLKCEGRRASPTTFPSRSSAGLRVTFAIAGQVWVRSPSRRFAARSCRLADRREPGRPRARARRQSEALLGRQRVRGVPRRLGHLLLAAGDRRKRAVETRMPSPALVTACRTRREQIDGNPPCFLTSWGACARRSTPAGAGETRTPRRPAK